MQKSIIVLIGLILGSIFQFAEAETPRVGSVLVTRGMVTAQEPTGEMRILASGEPLHEQDVLSTARGSFSMIELADGSRITLRPSTVFALEKFETKAGSENALFRLFRGGLRALTGLIGKRNPRGYRMRTNVATIGIRGTEFDARVCTGDECAGAGGAKQMSAMGEVDSPVVARVVFLKGGLKATDEIGGTRILLKGAPVYQSDVLETGSGDVAMVTFRDNSRITLKPRTRMQVENFAFGKKRQESAVFRLFRGGLRFLTGLVGKRERERFKVRTSIATIGIRGTGFDLDCSGPCAGDGEPPPPPPEGKACSAAPAPDAKGGATDQPGEGLLVHTWEGAVALQGAICTQEVAKGETGFIGTSEASPTLVSQPRFMRDDESPRPDRIEVDLDELFGTATDPEDGAPGLYVTVHDGHVILENDAGRVDLGRLESGWTPSSTEEPKRTQCCPPIVDFEHFQPLGCASP